MTKDQFNEEIRELVALQPDLTYSEIVEAVTRELNALAAQGLIGFGDDHALGGAPLEARVSRLFTESGFVVESGRPFLEDLVVRPAEGVSPAVPLVAEIKSSSRASPARDDLRQLDDWVFDLSGEEGARKHGLTNYASYFLDVGFPIPAFHPSPHKGVLVFNGPLGTEFEKRSTEWLGANEKEFAVKRNFCVISLPLLLKWHLFCRSSQDGSAQFWRTIHESSGLLPSPPVS